VCGALFGLADLLLHLVGDLISRVVEQRGGLDLPNSQNGICREDVSDPPAFRFGRLRTAAHAILNAARWENPLASRRISVGGRLIWARGGVEMTWDREDGSRFRPVSSVRDH
jgi:hypothetical protein